MGNYAINAITGKMDRVSGNSPPGSGDVNGPGSSVNNNIVVFSGTTGKIIKDTGISSIDPVFLGSVTALNYYLPATGTTPTDRGQILMANQRFLHAGGSVENLFAGYQAGNLTTASIGNTGIGYQALDQITSGISNTAVGHACLAQATSSGNYNTALGEGAMFGAAGAASSNTCAGWHALIGCSSDFNVAIGYDSMNSGIAGNGNTGIGYQALKGLTNGANNTCIGYRSGANYLGNETNNLCLANEGVGAEINTTRVGNSDTESCYIYGIKNQILESGKVVVIDASTDQAATLTGSPLVVVKSEIISILTVGPKSLMTFDRDFVLLQIISVTVDQDGAIPDSQSSIGYNAPDYNNLYVGGLTFPKFDNQYNPIFIPAGDYNVIPAGSEIFLDVDSVDTGATIYDIRVVLSGYYL